MKQVLARAQDNLHEQTALLDEGVSEFLQRIKELLKNEAQKLALASPTNRLRQGYSITMDARTRKVVKKKSDVTSGQELATVVYQGEVISKVL